MFGSVIYYLYLYIKSPERPFTGRIGGKIFKKHRKDTKNSDIKPTLPFTEFNFLQSYRDSFAKNELRRIHSQLPLKELAVACTSRSHKSKRGKKPLFSCEGEIALMFLKSYTALSDDGLIEMLNGSIHMQMFCDALIDPSCPIRDGKIVSAIRNRLAHLLDIDYLVFWQGSQASHCQHRSSLPPSHCQGQEKQACGVWGKGQQHTG